MKEDSTISGPLPVPDPSESVTGATASSIFISYKRDELAYADQLRCFLEKSGYDVWWDRELQTGSTWAAELDRQLTQAGCVIVLWSWRAAASPWVRHEASAAIGRGKYLPAMIEEVQVPDPFARIQAAELMGWDGRQDHPGFRALLYSLERELGQSPSAYELANHDRMTPWPSNVPRNPIVRAVLWTRRNLATLIAAVALATLAFLVLATEKSVKRLDGQVSTINSTINNLGSVLGTVDKTSTSLERLMHESRAQQEQVVSQLAEQVGATRNTSQDLTRVAGLIEGNVKTTNSLLDENLKRIDIFEIQLFINLNPLDLVDAGGRPLLPKKLADALRADHAGTRELPDSLFDPIVEALRSHYGEVRRAVFKRWEFSIELIRQAERRVELLEDPKSAAIRLQQEDGLSSFTISHISGGDDEKTGVQCWLIYRIATNPVAGFRTYEDFRGAQLDFTWKGDPRLIELTTIRFHLGMGGSVPLVVHRNKMTEEDGSWQATLLVPKDYLSQAEPRSRD